MGFSVFISVRQQMFTIWCLTQIETMKELYRQALRNEAEYHL